jgi:hypothetical protein
MTASRNGQRSIVDAIKAATRGRWPEITPRQRQTALDLCRRMAADGWTGPEVRKAIDRLLGHPLADDRPLESQCPAAFFAWQRRGNQRRAAV